MKKGFTRTRTNFQKENLRGRGFTLIELMIVIAILGVLIAVGLTSFRTSQMRARDSRRKNDLRQIASALEYYFNDKGQYPADEANIKIKGCGTGDNQVCEWGSAMTDSKGTIYMVKLPDDPSSGRDYRYDKIGTSYKLYASLEMGEQDIDYNSAVSGFCGSATCNYGVASSNTTP